MDALIFNSGFGSRIADLIKDSHKSLINIHGESVLSRQLRILASFDIDKVIITTGPNTDKLHLETALKNYPFEIVFVHNSVFNTTNYIYSMHLANQHLKNDTLILHGDLVFNEGVIEKLIGHTGDCVLLDEDVESYLKDFKAITDNGLVKEISTKFENYDFGLQPVYKLSKNSVIKWKNKVSEYVEKDDIKVYAENALNELLINQIKLKGVKIDTDFCKEIDTPEDYHNILNEINDYDYKQEILIGAFEEHIKRNVSQSDRVILVTFSIISRQVFDKLSFITNKEVIIYDDANPEKEDIVKFIKLIDDFNPDYVISVGGGSVIDFSKCLIDFSKTLAKHIAIPTTCGTGSESTRFAVYYENGIKQSLNKNKVLPDVAVLDSSLLQSLPRSVLISSVLDAFAQSIESYWAKKSTETSKKYSLEAFKIIYPILKKGLSNDKETLEKLEYASNLAGRAINITTTTSAHALSYNITKLFGIPHGYAVCMTLPFIWEVHQSKIEIFDKMMEEIVDASEVQNNSDLIIEIFNILNTYKVWRGVEYNDQDLDFLVNNVNLERLGNNPYKFNNFEIKEIYKKALNIK